MKVGELVQALDDYPSDVELLICGHDIPGMEGKAWTVTHLAPVEDGPEAGKFLLIEGARDPRGMDE